VGRIGRGMVLALLVAGCVAIDLGAASARRARAESEVPATNPFAGDQRAIAEGRSWYRAVCSLCHGIGADGAGERGYAADLRGFNKGFRKYVEVVKQGRDVPGRAAKMPPWGGVLSGPQIYQIGAYLETLAKEGANWGEAAP
jgi:mono/diheme cytochrome c family protein